MDRTVVRDENRELRFSGLCIGQASSWEPTKQRWMEIAIFRTEAGKYVVAKIGRSVVEGESDRHSGWVIETPEGVIETLYSFDEIGIRFLTNVARDALESAAREDPRIEGVLRVEEVE